MMLVLFFLLYISFLPAILTDSCFLMLFFSHSCAYFLFVLPFGDTYSQLLLQLLEPLHCHVYLFKQFSCFILSLRHHFFPYFLSFSCFFVDNLGGVPLTVNEDGGGDSPISIVYGNQNIPDEELLEVNNTIPNLIILSDAGRKCTTMRSKIIRSNPQGDEFEYIFLA